MLNSTSIPEYNPKLIFSSFNFYGPSLDTHAKGNMDHHPNDEVVQKSGTSNMKNYHQTTFHNLKNRSHSLDFLSNVKEIQLYDALLPRHPFFIFWNNFRTFLVRGREQIKKKEYQK